MRKVFITLTLALAGIIAPILACSDNLVKAGSSVVKASSVTAITISYRDEERNPGTSQSGMPWSEDKNLSNNDITHINSCLQLTGKACKSAGH